MCSTENILYIYVICFAHHHTPCLQGSRSSIGKAMAHKTSKMSDKNANWSSVDAAAAATMATLLTYLIFMWVKCVNDRLRDRISNAFFYHRFIIYSPAHRRPAPEQPWVAAAATSAGLPHIWSLSLAATCIIHFPAFECIIVVDIATVQNNQRVEESDKVH